MVGCRWRRLGPPVWRLWPAVAATVALGLVVALDNPPTGFFPPEAVPS